MAALAGVVALAEGAAVGAGFAALLVVLSIGTRLAAATGTWGWAAAYEGALALGAVAAGAVEAFPRPWDAGLGAAAALGLGMGLFVGLLAAALAEAVAALPVAARRLGVVRYLPRLVLAVVSGKALGALAWLAVPGLFARPHA
jgi:stage V sporulation protein AB